MWTDEWAQPTLHIFLKIIHKQLLFPLKSRTKNNLKTGNEFLKVGFGFLHCC
jgi:hypothetical protein